MPIYIANAFIYALVSLYLYIIILFFYLKISYMHSLIILLLIIFILAYIMPKVSYIYFTYRIRARGFGRLGRFWGVLGGCVRQTVVLWIVGGRWGRFACVFGRVVPCVRACGRAGVCPHHFLRAPNPWEFTLS